MGAICRWQDVSRTMVTVGERAYINGGRVTTFPWNSVSVVKDGSLALRVIFSPERVARFARTRRLLTCISRGQVRLC
jgi:hypothetical protein